MRRLSLNVYAWVCICVCVSRSIFVWVYAYVCTCRLMCFIVLQLDTTGLYVCLCAWVCFFLCIVITKVSVKCLYMCFSVHSPASSLAPPDAQFKVPSTVISSQPCESMQKLVSCANCHLAPILFVLPSPLMRLILKKDFNLQSSFYFALLCFIRQFVKLYN